MRKLSPNTTLVYVATLRHFLDYNQIPFDSQSIQEAMKDKNIKSITDKGMLSSQLCLTMEFQDTTTRKLTTPSVQKYCQLFGVDQATLTMTPEQIREKYPLESDQEVTIYPETLHHIYHERGFPLNKFNIHNIMKWEGIKDMPDITTIRHDFALSLQNVSDTLTRPVSSKNLEKYAQMLGVDTALLKLTPAQIRVASITPPEQPLTVHVATLRHLCMFHPIDLTRDGLRSHMKSRSFEEHSHQTIADILRLDETGIDDATSITLQPDSVKLFRALFVVRNEVLCLTPDEVREAYPLTEWPAKITEAKNAAEEHATVTTICTEGAELHNPCSRTSLTLYPETAALQPL